MLNGGFGSSILELLSSSGLTCPVRRLGIGDNFVEQGPRNKMLSMFRLDASGIYQEALAMLRDRKEIKSSVVV